MKVKVLIAQSCLTLWTPWTTVRQAPLSMTVAQQAHSPWNSPGKNTGVGSHSLLQRIFLTQGLNLGLLNCRQIFYHLSHQRRPCLVLAGANFIQNSLLKESWTSILNFQSCGQGLQIGLAAYKKKSFIRHQAVE